MSLAASLLEELVAALERDEELRARVERLAFPILARALREALGTEYVDRKTAKAAGVEWKAVREAARAGELEIHQVGRKAVVEREALRRWVASRPPPEPRAGPRRDPRPPVAATESPFERALARAADERRRRAG